jgi:hypothetical protein
LIGVVDVGAVVFLVRDAILITIHKLKASKKGELKVAIGVEVGIARHYQKVTGIGV